MSEASCRSIVRARSHGLCEANLPGCTGQAQSMHHRKKHNPRREWRPANVVDLCGHGTAGCHGWIEAHPRDAGFLGLVLTANQDPGETPVYLAYRGTLDRWLLDDTGSARRAEISQAC